MRGYEVSGVEGVTPLGESDDVVDCAGEAVSGSSAGEFVIDCCSAEVTGCAVCFAFGHASCACFAPP
jgi:hypothetical protein